MASTGVELQEAVAMNRSEFGLRLGWWICLSLLLLAGTAWAAPCTTATAACTEWIAVAGGPARTLLYRSYALDERNEGITRAVIVVHGAGRDADTYFRHVLGAAFLAGALEDTVVISPRFASHDGNNCRDTLAPNELNWNCQQVPAGWRVGGAAVDNSKIASFDVTDEILRKLARKEIFPSLRAIVVAGHSGGGQFVTRYEMANQVHDRLGLAITYVVANPSSYAYLDSLRPTPSALPSTVAAAAPGYIPPPSAKPPAPFVAFSDARNCTAYDSWPYGLQNRTGYSARLPDDQLKKQLAGRQTTYLLGELDILPLYGFDASCSAMAQGPTRLARGLAFGKYVGEKYGAQHKTLVVPACGHSARCMFTAEPTLPLIFPKE
jgi:pimeloyl-ACP methyl ester carboxylesterase